MVLSRDEMRKALAEWNGAWDRHDLRGVMSLFHENVIFDNFTGGRVEGKGNLEKAWAPWFQNHGGFRFIEEETFIDEVEQKALYRWRLEWPSPEKAHRGKPETRRGVDVMHFRDGKIVNKLTYCKTSIEVAGKRVKLVPEA